MNEKLPRDHFINSQLLDALGGTRDEDNLIHGAYLWGPEVDSTGEGILNHVLRASAVAYHLGKELKDNNVEGFSDLDLGTVVHATILHDTEKLYSESRENLSPEQKTRLGVPLDFRESSDAPEAATVEWLEKAGYGKEVIDAIMGHDFPQEANDNPVWQIVLIADYMTSQEVMTTDERIEDIRTRWITQRQEAQQEPRIEPERFETAAKVIRDVSAERFKDISLTQTEFIEKYGLNRPGYLTRWERFLKKSKARGREGRAMELVGNFSS